MSGRSSADRPAAAPLREDRADEVARRLAIPVLIAALASVPAVFLTLLDDPWGSVGNGLHTLSGAVLIAEAVVLLAIADDRRAWLRRNRWLVAVAVAIVPAVVLAAGPLQVLRLVRVAGALRIIRVGRILKAGRIVRKRSGLDHGWQRIIGIAVTMLCAAFVGAVLVDPTSASRRAVDGATERLGVLGVVLAGVILAVATYVIGSARAARSGSPAAPVRAAEQADHSGGRAQGSLPDERRQGDSSAE